MKTERLEKLNTARIRLFLRMTALILLVALYLAMPVYAWFYQGRTAAAVAKISNPTSIFIDAANREDIRYLNLAGIDVQNSGTNHADYVFSISGHEVYQYQIQLAYTTNNQFRYELYKAELYDAGTDAPGVLTGAFTVVEYTTHPTAGAAENQQYYVPEDDVSDDGDDTNDYYKQITLIPMNLDEGETEHLAYDYTDAVTKYHRDTYKTGENPITTYDNVNKYAEPLYWHADRPIIPRGTDGTGNFCDYYVLRVIWTAEAKNNKETDIIYIAAMNTAT